MAFFPLARFAAKLLAARKLTTYVASLGIASGDPCMPRNTSSAREPGLNGRESSNDCLPASIRDPGGASTEKSGLIGDEKRLAASDYFELLRPSGLMS